MFASLKGGPARLILACLGPGPPPVFLEDPEGTGTTGEGEAMSPQEQQPLKLGPHPPRASAAEASGSLATRKMAP